MNMLNVEIRKQLKEFELDVSFQAGEGCLGILGASGCGKSMTLKSVAGIVTPDSGRITAGERVLFDSENKINLKPQKRKTGYLFQNYALFPNMTVEENVAVGISKGDGKRKEKTAAMIERFRLNGLEKRYPGQLSGGQQQRTALARMLAYEPEILLLDEPFSAMDAYLKEGLRLELSKVIRQFQGTGVLVTHDRDEAYQLCSRLLFLDRGKVICQGKTKELFENPVTCQAARLTGCKNISRIERLGDYRAYAPDWGLTLDTDRKISEKITAAGIRAHDFRPLSPREAEEWKKRDGGNVIPVESPEVTEMPFEWYVLFGKGLWWKLKKDMKNHEFLKTAAPYVRIRPEDILLLEGEVL